MILVKFFLEDFIMGVMQINDYIFWVFLLIFLEFVLLILDEYTFKLIIKIIIGIILVLYIMGLGLQGFHFLFIIILLILIIKDWLVAFGKILIKFFSNNMFTIEFYLVKFQFLIGIFIMIELYLLNMEMETFVKFKKKI